MTLALTAALAPMEARARMALLASTTLNLRRGPAALGLLGSMLSRATAGVAVAVALAATPTAEMLSAAPGAMELASIPQVIFYRSGSEIRVTARSAVTAATPSVVLAVSAASAARVAQAALAVLPSA